MSSYLSGVVLNATACCQLKINDTISKHLIMVETNEVQLVLQPAIEANTCNIHGSPSKNVQAEAHVELFRKSIAAGTNKGAPAHSSLMDSALLVFSCTVSSTSEKAPVLDSLALGK